MICHSNVQEEQDYCVVCGTVVSLSEHTCSECEEYI